MSQFTSDELSRRIGFTNGFGNGAVLIGVHNRHNSGEVSAVAEIATRYYTFGVITVRPNKTKLNEFNT